MSLFQRLFGREEFWCAPDFRIEGDPFHYVEQLTGKVYRDVKGRTTLQFEQDGRSYFLKRHSGIAFTEMLKPLLAFKAPVVGARQEWTAIAHLEQHGVATMRAVAYGAKGHSSGSHRSFIITEDLVDTVSLEDLTRHWREQPPAFAAKRLLIEAVAKSARAMHGSGLNHRDYYLCHYLLDKDWTPEQGEPVLHLIDLHRAEIRDRVPYRWRMKDISGLIYGLHEFDLPLNRQDLLRFVKIYSGKPLREALKSRLWREAWSKGSKLHDKVVAAGPERQW